MLVVNSIRGSDFEQVVAGNSCVGNPPSAANYTPGGPAQQVTLCITTTVSNSKPVQLRLQSPGRISARERSLQHHRSHARARLDTQATVIAFPDLISTPPTANNYGAISPASPIAVASPTTLALLTLDIAPQASATNPSYVLSSI